jgi:hypothetical protein
VYCLESVDLPSTIRLEDVLMPLSADLKPVRTIIEGSPMMMLEGEALVQKRDDWSNTLYREVNSVRDFNAETKPIKVRLVPYYAWGNRGHSEMSVWLPVSR